MESINCSKLLKVLPPALRHMAFFGRDDYDSVVIRVNSTLQISILNLTVLRWHGR
jgi:hypothetical protein